MSITQVSQLEILSVRNWSDALVRLAAVVNEGKGKSSCVFEDDQGVWSLKKNLVVLPLRVMFSGNHWKQFMNSVHRWG